MTAHHHAPDYAPHSTAHHPHLATLAHALVSGLVMAAFVTGMFVMLMAAA